jgi:uncharacterized protein with LGFP repeats
VPDNRGRYAVYRGGRIYWTPSTAAHEVHGAILATWFRFGDVFGALGYPGSDTKSSGDRRSRYSNFERGRIYQWSAGTFEIHGSIYVKHETMHGVYGFLGYPRSDVKTSSDRRSRYTNFERGRIYLRDGKLTEIHGAIFLKHEQMHGVFGYLGYPTSDVKTSSDRRSRYSNFERGRIYLRAGRVTETHGALYLRHEQLGGVHGSLGYPTTDVYTEGSLRRQQFEHGRLSYNPSTGQVTTG